MATEGPLFHDGGNMVLGQEGRRSSLSGTTLSGPNGSAQFLAVVMSTTVDRTVLLASTAAQSFECYGILQNAPSSGLAADVGIFGITKAVAGTTIVRGQDLAMSSTAAGVLIPYTTGAGVRVGRAIENAATVGAVFSMALYGFGMGGAST